MIDAKATANESSSKMGRYGWVMAPFVVFVAMAIMFGYALRTGDPSKLPSALVGRPAPTYGFPPLDGLTREGASVPGLPEGHLTKDQVTVVNFWASWCGPCRDEHPVLVRLKEQAKVRLVGVNYKDPAAGGLRFLARYGNPFDAVGVDVLGRGAIEWGVYGMPETFVVDARGRIVYKHVGPMSIDDLERLILPAIRAAQEAKKLPTS
ncbi:MAG: DsbE family thiol:disulfide interchange protein [Hyphomicrobiaceae bacterium]